MPYLLRGALIEYGTDLLGPLKNVVIFQYNPESLSRVIDIPRPQRTDSNPEINQAGLPSSESISLTIHFSAADQLNNRDPMAQAVGIGPQLAALEKMVHPNENLNILIEQAVDAVAKTILGNSKTNNSCVPIPRESYPAILFIWGTTRILPVIIESMSITEQQYDSLLNPIQAEVAISLRVIVVDNCSNDEIAKGAQKYSNLTKESMAMSNLANTKDQIGNLISFI